MRKELDKVAILENNYDARVDIVVGTSLGRLADTVIDKGMGKDMLEILVSQMLNIVISLIRVEKDKKVHKKEWMEKLRAKKEYLENLLKLVNEIPL